MPSSDSHSQALSALGQLLVADASIGDTLNRVANLSVDAVSGALFAGITMLDNEERATTAIFTDSDAPEIDQAQYETGQGPCLDAWRSKSSIRLDDLENAPPDYEAFAHAALEHGIRSTLSMPLIAGDTGIGALNFYSSDKAGFSAGDEEAAREFATAASVVMANAVSYWGAYDLAQQLTDAMDTPTVIEQAKWIGPVGASELEGAEPLQALLRSFHLSRTDDLPTLVAAAGERLGARRTVLHLVDYDQVALIPFGPPGLERPLATLAIEGTIAGRAFQHVDMQVSVGEGSQTVWAPVVDGAERLGVLELELPADTHVDADLRQAVRDVAALVAELVMTRSLYGDAIERLRRRAPLTLPAELQWRLLPPLTFISPRVAISGILAPSTEVAGDSFDYAVNGDVAHIAIIDAMGHGIEAALLASVTMAALRNARRSGAPLADTVAVVDRAIADTFGPDKFITGIFGELDTESGLWSWTTCGHPPALLLRQGRVVKVLDSVIGAPLGLGLIGGDAEVRSERLEPGDRLVLYTDGVVEARDAAGSFFGLDRLVDFAVKEASAARPVAEALRRLNHEILHHQEGSLQDDATTVMVEWLTDEPTRGLPQLESQD